MLTFRVHSVQFTLPVPGPKAGLEQPPRKPAVMLDASVMERQTARQVRRKLVLCLKLGG